MKLSTKIALSALLLSLGSGLEAQVRTRATFAGNSDIGVLNVARATAVASTSPHAKLELWAEGNFLNHSGRYYTASAEGTGSSSNIGTGLWALRAGNVAVRSGWIFTFFTGPQTSVRRSLPQAVEQISVGGVPLTARGTVTVDLSINARYLFRRFGVAIETKDPRDPMLSGDATASVTVEPLFRIYSANVAQVMNFGSQEFSGTAEVWSSGDTSSLRYEMGPMFLYVHMFTSFANWLRWNRIIVLDSRNGFSHPNFL